MSSLNVIRNALPRPGQVPVKIRENLRVLLLSNANNNLGKRVKNELAAHKASVRSVEVSSSDDVSRAVADGWPELVVCPFLTTRVPNELMHKSRPFLIVHPGIAGDRGASSLDWAILEKQPEWGVTVLEANEEMDAGDIWSTHNFKVPGNATKTGLYNGGVADTAVQCVVDAVSRYCQDIDATPLEGNHEAMGELKRNMKHADRTLNWSSMTAEEIVRRVRMSDTSPGALTEFNMSTVNKKIRVFDAHVENAQHCSRANYLLKKGAPGEPVARQRKGVLVKTADDQGVWFGQMKENKGTQALKLPFTDGMPELRHLPLISGTCAHDDIRVTQDGSICYVHFDFYNGCMDTDQAQRLQRTLEMVDNNNDIKVVALMGGERFFSTGIHLCVIQNAEYKEKEAWLNINAIDDVIETIVNMKNKISVAVMRGNAAAGGAMLAAACDVTVAHPGVLMTPSYRSMNLFGSEYWTYFLPQRVGYETATKLIQGSDTVSAQYAQSIGMLDDIVGYDRPSFSEELPGYLQRLVKDGRYLEVVNKKMEARNSEWLKQLDRHREFELSQMRANFVSPDFLKAMHQFAYKLKDAN